MLAAGIAQALVSAALTGALSRADAASVAGWCPCQSAEQRCDLDADGTSDCLRTRGGALRVSFAQGASWRAPLTWLVTEAHAADLDGDGCAELVVLAWRRGSYGSSHPFWDTPDNDLSQHVFVLSWDGATLAPRWMSSALGTQVARLALDDRGSVLLTDRGGTTTRWCWQTWGLTRME